MRLLHRERQDMPFGGLLDTFLNQKQWGVKGPDYVTNPERNTPLLGTAEQLLFWNTGLEATQMSLQVPIN